MVDVAESMSPFFLGLGLTALSVSLWPTRPGLAALGVAVAILGYGIRNVITQTQHMGTERQLLRLQGELENLVVTDSLTGIANRRGFDQQLSTLWKRGQQQGTSLSILMIDIDHFKHVNDDHGHVIGDNCLRAVAIGLAELLGPHESTFARYGGEEFAVLLPALTLAQVIAVAESVRKKVEGLWVDSPDTPLGVTVSVGVACSLHTPAENGKALLVFADTALRAAKAQGRNRVMVAHDAAPARSNGEHRC
jgi:diguanylate cyclase (GGDEF)-like protein